MKKADKRKFPRISFNVEVKYKVVRGRSPKAQKSQARNISAAGICIMILEKVRAGTFLNLEFSLPGADTTIIAKGKVMWVEKISIYAAESHVAYDCGVAFMDIASGDRETISHHVMLNLK